MPCHPTHSPGRPKTLIPICSPINNCNPSPHPFLSFDSLHPIPSHPIPFRFNFKQQLHGLCGGQQQEEDGSVWGEQSGPKGGRNGDRPQCRVSGPSRSFLLYSTAAVLYCTVLYCTVLYCTVLYYTVLYCTVLYCTVLYCTALRCTILYCTVSHYILRIVQCSS